MHFWIDKRSQGCGFSGRHSVPPSLSGYGRHYRFSGFHPKPMVTPVHRFQSIESVANNGLRYARPRPPTSVHLNGASATSSIRSPPVEMIVTPTPRPPSPHQHPKLKCGVWVFFAVVTVFLAGAKYYFHGVNMGMEAFAFCSLLVFILIIGGLVSLYEAITATAHSPQGGNITVMHMDDHDQESENVVPLAVELPPPPYHIAIMLPSQNQQTEIVQVIQDSPPPSYEKAVT